MLVDAAVPEHVASFGPKRLKVMVPVGLNPPESVAVSWIEPPRVMAADAVVDRVGVAGVTTTDSLAAPQALVAELLLASPP